MCGLSQSWAHTIFCCLSNILTCLGDFRGSLELNITGIQFAEHFLEQCELDFKSQKLYKCTFVIKIAKTGNLTMLLCWQEKSILYRETSIFRRLLHVKQENPVAALVQRVFLHCISAFFNPAVSSTARTSKLWKRAKRCSSTSAHCCVFSNFCLVLYHALHWFDQLVFG